MLTVKIKINKIFNNDNSLNTSIFCTPLTNRGKLIIDEDFGTIKVSGAFPKALHEGDIATITVNDFPNKAQYYKLLFMGRLPDKETFKNYNNFINNIELNENLFDRAEKLPQMVADIKDIYKVIASPEDIDTTIVALKNKQLRKDVDDNYKLISILKEKYIHSYNIYYFMEGLEKLGISEIDVRYRILKKFPENEELPSILKEIEKNPYMLLESGHVNFKTADDIALKVGVAADDNRRVLAAAEYNLKKLGDSGKSWSYLGVFTKQLISGDAECGIESINTTNFKFKISSLSKQLVEVSSTSEKSKATWISKDKKRIASRYYYAMEKELSDIIKTLDNAQPCVDITLKDVERAIKSCQRAEGIKYTTEQKEAVKNALQSNVVVVPGPAGTGKSTVAKVLIELYEGNRIVTALSGKAALRIGETTRIPGSTMHALLNRIVAGFLDAEIVILDEASMIGIDIILSFFKRIKPGTKVIILGDDSQLTPIGAGNFFADLLKAKSINVNHITKIHRQALDSKIIDFATKVRLQKPMEPIEQKFKDFKLVLKNNDKDILSATLLGFKNLLKKYPVQETLIVTPYKTRGSVNAYKINNKIQSYLIKNNYIDSSKYKYLTIKDTDKKFKICVGDRVLNTQNNYNAQGEHQKVAVMNGALGTVIDINKKAVKIDFDGIGKVEFKAYDLTNILLGYCITVHKSQGSQVKGVIYTCPVDIGRLGCKEQVYTAVTRARELCEVIGQIESINQCILTKELNSKQTLLTEFLDGVEAVNNSNVIDVEFKEVKKKKVAPKRSKKKKKNENEIEVLPGQVHIDEALELASNMKSEKLPKTEEEKKRAKYDKNNERRRKLRRNEAGLTSRQQSKADLIKKVHELKEQGLKGVEIAKELNINKATVSKYLKL